MLHSDPDDVVCKFIDEYIQSSIPDETEDEELHRLVKAHQSHGCAAYCCKKKKTCQFGFPKVPSPQTLIADKLSDDVQGSKQLTEIARQKISKVYEIIDQNDNIQLQTIIEQLNIREIEYVNLLWISSTSPYIILKHATTEMQINGYNPTIMKIWKGNMDIQYITDAISAVMYVCSYMMKAEKGMGDLLKCVCKEVHREEIQTQLKAVGRAFLDIREVSAQEAAMCILLMHLMQKS